MFEKYLELLITIFSVIFLEGMLIRRVAIENYIALINKAKK